MLEARDTLEADLALMHGQPHYALTNYARSMQTAQARGDVQQVWYDLRGVAGALALAGDDAEALEVVGLAESQARELGARADAAQGLPGGDHILAAEGRLGPHMVRELKALGVAVPAGERVVRACHLTMMAKPI